MERSTDMGIVEEKLSRSRRLRPVIRAMTESVALPAWGEFSGAIWFESLVLQESGADPRAIRYEAHQDIKQDADVSGHDDGMLEDDKSYGLCQVMGYNIRKMVGVAEGVPMNFGFALLPLTNLTLGLRVILGELPAARGQVGVALARYNGGPSGNPRADGTLRNQEYVNLVAAWTRRVQEDQ